MTFSAQLKLAIHRRERSIIPLAICLLFVFGCGAQEKLSLTDSIPMDPAVRHGVLKNGLSYYILKQADSKQIEFGFIELAGHYHAGPGERNVAHLIEHLSIRTTENFQNGLANYFRGHGLTLGKDITAMTNATTNYYLTIPSGDSILLDHAFLALHDWAQGRLYLPSEVEEERSAVLREASIADNQVVLAQSEGVYLLLDNSPLYAPNLSETIEDTKNVSIDRLRSFDRRWYRPNMQAVIIVGDINESEVEKKLSYQLSSIKSDATNTVPYAEVLKKYDVSLTGKNKLVSVSHGAAQPGTHITILQKRKAIPGMDSPSTLNDFRTKLIDRLYNEMVNERLKKSKISDRGIFQSVNHFISRGAIHPFAGIDALVTDIKIDNAANVKPAVELITIELTRIETWGFTESELVEAKQVVINSFADAGRRNLRSIVGELAKHFIGKAAFSSEEVFISKKLMGTLNVAEINGMARSWIGEDGNTDVLFSVPDKIDTNVPSEQEFFATLSKIRNTKIARSKDRILKDLPEPVLRKSEVQFFRTELAELNATKLTLSNGVEIVIKSFGNESMGNPQGGQIFLQGFRRGGFSHIPAEDYASASASIRIVTASGIASLNASEFRDWLYYKRKTGYLSVYPYITESEEGFEGRSSSNNAEELLKLVYLYCKSPRMDKEIFNSRFNLSFSNRNINRSPDIIFADSIEHTMNPKRVANVNINPVNFQRCFQIYQQGFGDIAGYQFVIAGYFNADEIIKLVVKYLGAIPRKSSNSVDSGQNEQRAIVNSPTLATGTDRRITLVGDSTGNVKIHMLYPGVNVSSDKDRLILEALAIVLRQKLFSRLREREKTVYDVMSPLLPTRKNSTFFFDVQFETSTSDKERTIAAVNDEIASMSIEPISDSIFNNALIKLEQEIKEEVNDPFSWVRHIAGELRTEKPLTDISQRLDTLRSVQKRDLVEEANRLLNAKNCIIFELL